MVELCGMIVACVGWVFAFFFFFFFFFFFGDILGKGLLVIMGLVLQNDSDTSKGTKGEGKRGVYDEGQINQIA
jgi:hypothetical protein